MTKEPAIKNVPPDLAVVIRGDLISSTGYARAARALASIIASRHEVFGVSLHEDPSDRLAIFPGRLISDESVRQLARKRKVIIIHHTTPDFFLPTAHAYNIGCFYWETKAIPRSLYWPEHIASMDAIWAPTRFIARFVASCAYRGPIIIVPWPHDFEPVKPNADTGRLGRAIYVDLLEKPRSCEAPASWKTTTFSGLRANKELIYLAIQTLSPRKGLPILLREWLSAARIGLAPGTVLLLKLNFRHAHNISSDAREHIALSLERAGAEAGNCPQIAIISETLNDMQMSLLLEKSDCLVSASLGEGFGGPVVEALAAGKPVIAPRHTSLSELLPDDYPLHVSTWEACVQLHDLPDVYPPTSTWFLPRPGELASRMAEFGMLTWEERAMMAKCARLHAASFCGQDVVRPLILRELAQAASRATWS